MFCIGLTGNIASGKSTVAAIFKGLGVPIISADAIARRLTIPHELAYKAIYERLGSGFFLESGELNRRALRQLIFKDKNARLWLESLLHPLIKQKISAELKEIQGPYCVIEIPLLKAKQDYPYLNRILLVASPIKQQIIRIVLRDKIDPKEAKMIIATQPTRQERYALADDVITNNGAMDILEQNVFKLHKNYLKLAAQQE